MESVISSISSGLIKRIAIVSGAGISTNSGIPDFRSPGGMYDTLRPELLTATEDEKREMKHDPTTVVSWSLFRNNQFPYLEVRRPFILGTAEQSWKATAAHYFIKLLNDKGILQRLYTQNIDGLDHQLEIEPNKIVNVHGTLASCKCEFCGTSMAPDTFRALVRSNIRNIYDADGSSDPSAPAVSSHINCPSCARPGLKPNTVLYGRSLPDTFWHCLHEDFPDSVDLIIVIGTSLTVHPACDIVTHANEGTIRILINQEKVGTNLGMNFEESGKDIFLSGNADEICIRLAAALDWLGDLYAFRGGMAPLSAELLERAWSERGTSEKTDA